MRVVVTAQHSSSEYTTIIFISSCLLALVKRAINNCGHRVVSHDSLIWKYLDCFAHFSASVALSAQPTPISPEGILLEYKHRL